MTREERRNSIIDAAGVVFGEKGFEATRMDDVATVAGIAKGLLYKHFESKDALFEALVDRQGRQYVAELRGALMTAQPTSDPMEILGKGLGIWLRQVSDDRGTFQWNDPGVHSAYDDLRDRMREVIVEALVAAEPRLDPAVGLLLAAAIQGAAENLGLAWRENQDKVPEEVALALLSGFCWGGISLLQTTVEPATGARS